MIELYDKGKRYLEVSYYPVVDEDQEVVSVIAVSHDITEKRRIDEVLRDSEERTRSILQVIPDIIIQTNVQGEYLDIRTSSQDLLLLPKRELMGKGISDLLPENVATRILECIKTAIDTNRLQSVEYELELPTGRFYFEARIVSSGDDKALALIRDITERKRAEEERERLQAQKMEAIGSLAGGVAHDLNNLLSPILGYGEMLRDDLDPEDIRRESVDEIIGAGLRARDLVRQLLAFSRKQILEFKPLDLNKVVAGLKRLLRHTIREDIQMEFDLTPDAGVVMADIGQIEQVIMNLSANAADAMPEGGELTIETQKVYLDEEYANYHISVKPGEYIMLAVSDSGVGMDESTRERIFDPFFSTKGESGTGLGLATVYGIVKQHGGNIWVYSEPGEGSTFKVYLPVVETPELEETTSADTINDLKGSETILIVEDSDQVRRLVESVLKRNGYQVLTAKDGAQALETMASHDRPVNLLLTDVVLPGMNGRELYEKAAEASPSMKVLFMSGYTDNVIAHRGVLDEGTQFIQKPFTVYGLVVKVRKVLDEKPRK